MGKATVLVWLTLVVCVAAPVAQGQTLWGYYPINENDFKDYSGNGHNGTPVDGAVTVADPERGWVASFNKEPAKPSRVNCGTNDPSAGGQLTVSAWLYWRGLNGNWQGIAGKSFSYTDRRWVLQLRDTDGMIQWGGADNANLHIFSTVAPAADEWQHVVGTCDGTTSKVYINSKIVGEGPGRFNPGAAGANVTLGFGEDRSDYDESFNGLMDEIHILTRGLSLDQVKGIAQGIVPAFTTAREPNPANGATGVAMPLFRWTAGDGARFHNIYMGTTAELGQVQLVGPRSVLAMYYHTAPLEPGKTYYWRVDEIENDGVTIHAGDVWSFTTQALTAYGPNPANGANTVSPAPVLAWLPGQAAAKHQVYFSTDPEAVKQGAAGADKGVLTETTFTPGPLQGATTYYWRVDEIGAGGATQKGPAWSFTTILPVDDFESYTDQAGSEIFTAWADGFADGFKSSGSTVGNDPAPFAEQKIVHGGKQSMPLDYNNVKSPFYSEAEQTFATAQDWTINGVDTLVLYVRGRATNGPASVYVTLKDASNRAFTVSYPDPAVLTLSKWTEWKIPLSDFAGVSLTRIKKIVIGVGDKSQSAPGSAGLIYVDDIHLTRP